jgi:hypothetical protein
MLFCEIEDSAVRRLSERCDRFIQKMAAENSGGDGGQGENGGGNEGESGNDEIMLMETKNVHGGEDEDEYG